MAKNIKIVAESMQEWENEVLNEGQTQQLNESAKGLLLKFVENPKKTDKFTAAFARQISKVKGLKDALLKLSDENKMTLAKQALKSLEDPKKAYPWVKIEKGKITGAGALDVVNK